MLTKDGREVVMLTNGVPMLDDAGNLLGYRGVAKDITERKRADDALHESEKRFRELFDSMSSGVAVYETRDQGVSFIFKDFNQGAERIDSLRREEVVGRNVQQVFPGIEKFGLLAVLRRVWQTGRPERHPVGQYEDDRISGWRENYVYRLASGEVVAVYDDTTARVQAEAALRDSEQRYRETIDALPEAVFETGPDGQLTFVNRAGLAAFGLAEADIARGVNVLQVLVPEDRERAAANIRQVVGGESRPGTEYMALRKDGSRFPAIVHADRIIRNGQPVGLRGILVDISARKLAEDALRESEEKYRLVVDNAGEAVLVVQDGKMVFTNPRTSEIIEYPREELLGRPFVEFIHPDDRAFVADNYRRRIAGEDVPVWYEFRVVRRDGEARHVDINGVRIDWNGRSATLNFLSDVTERRAAESGLRESELKFRAIFDNASDGMFLIEQESRRFVLANSSCLRMLGYSADEFVNLRITDLHPEEDLPFIFEQIGAFVKGETGRRGDTRFKRKDGSLLPADTSPAGMMLGDKKCILIMFRDITEQKQAEAEIAQKNTQLIELNAVKNQLLGMAAHDLRNPLSVVSTASAFLLDDAGRLLPEAKRTDFLRRINFSSEFMLKMIDDLLDVARIEAGKLDLKLEDGDLCCLIEENLTMNRMLAKKKDIRLDFASERGLPLFRFDRGKVEQVLNNLISNALKFSEPGTAVTVQASRVNGSVVVSVRDHGQGIPAEELDKLFKPFSKTSVRGTGGERSTGLGLAICRKIVEGHHGRIWAESEVGKGSVFSFSLPVPVAALE
jgi:PAS domain S-box-containing protein